MRATRSRPVSRRNPLISPLKPDARVEFRLTVSQGAMSFRAEEGDAYALRMVSESKSMERLAKAALRNLSEMLGKKVTAHYDDTSSYFGPQMYDCSVPVKSWGEAKAVYDMVEEQMNSRRAGEVCVGVRFVWASFFFFYPGGFEAYMVLPENQSNPRVSEPTMKDWLAANKP